MSTAEFQVASKRRNQFLPITPEITAAIAANGWGDGVLTVFVPHTTAGVTINENADPDVARDMEGFCDKIDAVREESNEKHDQTAVLLKAMSGKLDNVAADPQKRGPRGRFWVNGN